MEWNGHGIDARFPKCRAQVRSRIADAGGVTLHQSPQVSESRGSARLEEAPAKSERF